LIIDIFGARQELGNSHTVLYGLKNGGTMALPFPAQKTTIFPLRQHPPLGYDM